MGDERRVDINALAFFGVIVLAEVSPALPHDPPPVLHWWLGGVALTVASFALDVVGRRSAVRGWLQYLPMTLFFAAVQMLRAADGNGSAGFSPLLILPVVWYALYGNRQSMYLALVGVAAVQFGPLILVGEPEYPVTLWRGAVLWVLILGLVGLTAQRLVAALRDKSAELATSEARFRTAFNDAPTGITLVGAAGAQTGVYLQVNRAMCALLGRSEDELVGRSVLEFTHPDDRGIVEQHLLAPEEKQQAQTLERRYLHSSGREVSASVTYSRIEVEPGGEPCFLSHVQDSSLRRDVELDMLTALDQQRATTERMHELDRTRVEISALLTDEARTPRERLDRALELLAGLAAADAEPELVDIEAVVQGAIESIRPVAEGRDQVLQVEVSLTGAQVSGDAEKVDRVLANLLDNAVKFTPPGGAIDAQARVQGDAVVIDVSDTGIGIDDDELDRIFDRFYRARAAAEQAIPGTGLGLAIAKAIVEQHDGTIRVFSERGTGSTFTLTLPLRRG